MTAKAEKLTKRELRVARALYLQRAEESGRTGTLDNCSPANFQTWIEAARAAIAAYESTET